MPDHDHKFMLPPPNGPTAVGICGCGERREMNNSLTWTYNPKMRGNTSRSRSAGREDTGARLGTAIQMLDD
jgi:hypothetical protein